MNKSLVPTRETCQRLQELVELNTEFHWYKQINVDNYRLSNPPHGPYKDEVMLAHGTGKFQHFAEAPLLSELLEAVPPLQIQVWKHESEKFVAKWLKSRFIKNFDEENPAEAAAQLLIWLVENNHINPDEL